MIKMRPLVPSNAAKLLTRREAAHTILRTLGGATLVACAGADHAGSSATTPAPTTTTDGGSSVEDAALPPPTGSADTWATGGTKSMVAASSYPNPFATPAATCTLAIAATEGPCTEAADQVRKDISEGLGGLPMRLALRFVDADCKPIANAKVKIWHTQLTGSYSGNTPNNGACLKLASDAEKHYFRGVQTTDADGRVDFDSCFPGWYGGRTIHIHFTITVGNKSATSQLVFEQSLVSEIFSSHSEYSPFGQPDTTNANDNVLAGHDPALYTLTTARMTDGAMLAYRAIAVTLA
jgi:protocatechuate 3,4-dioxygenase beta subunit